MIKTQKIRACGAKILLSTMVGYVMFNITHGVCYVFTPCVIEFCPVLQWSLYQVDKCQCVYHSCCTPEIVKYMLCSHDRHTCIALYLCFTFQLKWTTYLLHGDSFAPSPKNQIRRHCTPWLIPPSINPMARAEFTSLGVTFHCTFILRTKKETCHPGSPAIYFTAMERITLAPGHMY